VEGMASDDTNERQQLTQNKTRDHGGGYNPLLDDEDDISLGTEEFSRISEAELNDIRVNNEEEIEENDNNIVPDQVISNNNLHMSDPEIQGVDKDDDTGIKGVNGIENDNNPIPVIEEVGNDNDNHMINKEIDDEEYNINHRNNDLNSDNIKEDMLEHTINDSPLQTHYITRRGRNIKLRKDLYDNYNFLQRAENDLKPNDMSTQWSLKQGLKRFPEETKKTTFKN
jgi:hypothetical protein